MFCSKCGAQIPDDAAFCPICGEKIGAAPAATPAAAPAEPAPQAAPQAAPEATPATAPAAAKSFGPEPLGSMKTFGPKQAFRLPDIPGFVMLALTQLIFWFSYIGLWRAVVTNPYNGSKVKYVYTILASDLFSLNALLGFGKVFMILSILISLACFAYFFIDFAKLTNGKIPQKLLNFLPLAYYGLVAVSLFFTLIGSLTVIDSGVKCGPTFGWFLSFIVTGGAIFFSLMPGILKNIVGAITKKK